MPAQTERKGPAMPKRMSLSMDDDVAVWVSYVSGLKDVSMNTYVNQVIHRDMETASSAVAKGFEAFKEAREEA